MTIGVVAIQGDFERHLAAIARLDGLSGREVRVPEDLVGVNRLIIPGGESTTVGKLMERFGLGPAIRERATAGMPVWGTCMGMIMMAREVEGRDQYRLDLLDITVRRNAFGAQVHSFESTLTVRGIAELVPAVFIRAPVVTEMGPSVEALASHDGQIVMVRQAHRLGTSFHPELTDDTGVLRMFLTM